MNNQLAKNYITKVNNTFIKDYIEFRIRVNKMKNKEIKDKKNPKRVLLITY